MKVINKRNLHGASVGSGDFLCRNIKRSKTSRRIGMLACVLFCVILVAIITPVYYEGTDYASAAVGVAKESTLTYTSNNGISSVALKINSSTGTFATSTDDQKASFSISTNNYTGYTVKVATNTSDTSLRNGVYNIASIDDAVTAADFSGIYNTDLNNRWGYIPNYYNSVANTDNYYYPAPANGDATTLMVTDAPNSGDGVSNADRYTIGLGIRADYTNPSGTYTNNTFVIQYVANEITYAINFIDNTGDATIANLPGPLAGSTNVTSLTLPSNIPTRTGYIFSGKWCSVATSNNGTICNGTTYEAGSSFGIDQTDSNFANLYAVWIKINTITVNFDEHVASVAFNGSCGDDGDEDLICITQSGDTFETVSGAQFSGPVVTYDAGYVGAEITLSGAGVLSDNTFTSGNGDAIISITSSLLYEISIVTDDSSDTVRVNGGSWVNEFIGEYLPGTKLVIDFDSANSNFVGRWSTSFGSIKKIDDDTIEYTVGSNNDIINIFTDFYTMQDLSAESCLAYSTTNNDIYNIYDIRDDKGYTVSYINGKCWMTQNLRFVETDIDPSDTNIDVAKTLTYYDLEEEGDIGGACYAEDTDGNGFDNACIKDSGDRNIGVWYNYAAASAGTVSSDNDLGDGTYSICPKGWTLPTGPNTVSGTDFNILLGNTNAGYQETSIIGFDTIGGRYDNGSLTDTNYSWWWSANAGNAISRYTLLYNSDNERIDGSAENSRQQGLFIRCVLAD